MIGVIYEIIEPPSLFAKGAFFVLVFALSFVGGRRLLAGVRYLLLPGGGIVEINQPLSFFAKGAWGERIIVDGIKAA